MILIIGGSAPTIYISDLSLHGRPMDIVANRERKTAKRYCLFTVQINFFRSIRIIESKFSLIGEAVW